MAHTLLQRTNLDGFPKPGELIEITGAHELEASDRAILNLLYQHAHDSGRLMDDRAEWEIPLSALQASRHKGNERIRDSLDRLMRVVVTVPLPDRKTGEPRILKTHLFDFFDLSADEGSDRATVRFGLPTNLQPVLAQSNRWGRIKAEVVCAMTSKYAIALYELVQLRANMDRCIETFPIPRFRDLLGVPPGAYNRGNDFARFVIQPAMLEVNGLSDVGVDLIPVRRSRFAPIEAVTVLSTPGMVTTGSPNDKAIRNLVAARAYELWESQGRPDGRDLINWRQAEQEIMSWVGDGEGAVPSDVASQANPGATPGRDVGDNHGGHAHPVY